MEIKFYFLLAAALLGIGIGSALVRKNILLIIMSIVTAGAGVLIAMSTIGQATPGGAAQNQSNHDGTLFALCICSVLLIQVIIGCSLAYRRYLSSGETTITEGNELRH